MLILEKQSISEWVERIPFDEIDKHPNILIAARLWEDARFEAAVDCYKFMRYLDDLVDNRKATGEVINCMEKKQFTQEIHHWMSCLQQKDNSNSVLKRVSDTVNRFHIPLHLFQIFSKSMIYDVNNDGFETYASFLDYAEGASVAPASVFVHLCGLVPCDQTYLPPQYNVIEVARPCALFSYLVHIIRDFEKDQCENLNYFAKDILSQNGLHPSELKTIAKTGLVPDNFRNVIRFYMQQAEKYRQQTLSMIEKVSPLLQTRYLSSLHVIFHLYDLVYQKIDVENSGFSAKELNPTTNELKERLYQILEANF